MPGIKETRELAVGIAAVSVVLIDLAKDGFQFTDLTDFYTKVQSDPALKAKVEAAFAGVSQVGGELADIDTKEGIALAFAVAEEVVGSFLDDRPTLEIA